MALTLRVAGCRALSFCHIVPSCSKLPSHTPLPVLFTHSPKPFTPPALASLTRRLSVNRFLTRASDGEAAAVSVADAPTAEVSVADAPAVPEAKPAAAAEVSPVELLDFRVGRVLKAWKHPEADGLYVEEVDVGEAEGPRTIVSGLVGYVPLEEMQDRPVVVFANLKPRNMRGIKSNGMLVAASDAEHTVVELVTPPADAQPGERIWFGSEDNSQQAAAAGANQVQKKKIWEAVQPKLNTSDGLEARYEERIMRTSAGPCTVKSLKGARLA